MRSLAKRADDRFETARDMRKMLEAALREGDVGARRDPAARPRRASRICGAAPRVARAGPRAAPRPSLADELEPAPSPTAQVQRRPRRTWLVRGARRCVVLAACGAAAFFALHDRHHALRAGRADRRASRSPQGKTFGDAARRDRRQGHARARYASYARPMKALLESSSVLATRPARGRSTHMVVLPPAPAVRRERCSRRRRPAGTARPPRARSRSARTASIVLLRRRRPARCARRGDAGRARERGVRVPARRPRRLTRWTRSAMPRRSLRRTTTSANRPPAIDIPAKAHE